jgi:CheY-like chemotaxis protein
LPFSSHEAERSVIPLPAVASISAWKDAGRGLTSRKEGRGAVILVVERDAHVRELEAFFLERAGFTVSFARDGHEALQLVTSIRPNIVITEILVPGLDGLAVCREIKGNPDLTHIAVLIFSILAASGRAREAGADAFLMKPLEERRLLSTVQELLALHEEESA